MLHPSLVLNTVDVTLGCAAGPAAHIEIRQRVQNKSEHCFMATMLSRSRGCLHKVVRLLQIGRRAGVFKKILTQ